MNTKNKITTFDINLFSKIKDLIIASKSNVALYINAAMSQLYWEIGNCINTELLIEKRQEYGEQVIYNIALQLRLEFGSGWSEKQLRHCLRIADTFPEKDNFYALSRELSWTHLRSISYLDNPLKRAFYLELCQLEKWSTRTLQERINTMLFERTAISKKPEETIKHDIENLKKNQELSHNLVFKDPYLLDFLGLKDAYSEADLENSILLELQKFIIELGSDFAFLARQKRITIDNTDYYIDLLFYHRRLRSLVAIELKLGKFEAAYKGQMELYLRWLEKYEKVKDENPPIGLILCASKNKEHIELLQLDKSNIKVAEYITHLPDIKILEQKLALAIKIAKNKFESK